MGTVINRTGSTFLLSALLAACAGPPPTDSSRACPPSTSCDDQGPADDADAAALADAAAARSLADAAPTGVPADAALPPVEPPADPITVSLTTTEDAFVRDGIHAQTNFGAEVSLAVKLDSVDFTREGYLRFAMKGAPAGAIVSAILAVQVRSIGGVATHEVAGVPDDTWTEAGLTYANRPAPGPALASLALDVTRDEAVLTADVTAFVVAEVAAGDSNVSFNLRSVSPSPPDPDDNSASYYARESDKPARLIVTVAP